MFLKFVISHLALPFFKVASFIIYRHHTHKTLIQSVLKFTCNKSRGWRATLLLALII